MSCVAKQEIKLFSFSQSTAIPGKMQCLNITLNIYTIYNITLNITLIVAPPMGQNGCLVTDISSVVWKLVVHVFIHFLLSWV